MSCSSPSAVTPSENAPSARSTTYLVWMLLSAQLLMIFVIDIHIPCLPTLKVDFNSTEFIMQLSIIANPLMSLLCALPFGYLADRYSSRWTMLLGVALLGVGSVICAVSETSWVFLGGRVVQSVGASAVSISIFTTLAALFSGIVYAQYLALVTALFPIGFAAAPIVGAQLFEWFGWRSTFWFLVIWSVCMLALFRKLLPKKQASFHATTPMLPQIRSVLFDPSFVRYALCHAIPISIITIFTTNACFVFMETFSFSPVAFSMAQSIPILINCASTFAYRAWLPRLGLQRALRIGLWGHGLFLAGLIGVVSDLIPTNAWGVVGLVSFFNLFMPYLVVTALTYAIERENRGIAVACVSIVRNAMMIFPSMLACCFFDGTFHSSWVVMMLLCIAVIWLVIPLVGRKAPIKR